MQYRSYLVLNEKIPGLRNHVFEQKKPLVDNIDHSIDAQNFIYQNKL